MQFEIAPLSNYFCNKIKFDNYFYLMRHFIIKTRLILKQNDKILLLAQTSENGGKFTLPGGTVENKEFAKATLIRECKEEIGIQLVAADSVSYTHLTLPTKA